MTDWDETVPLAGTLEVHWSCTMDEEGDVIVWISPYGVMPDVNREDGAERTGSMATLGVPIGAHDDLHITAAAIIMVRYATDEWIKPYLSARIARAMREQRERQGGYDEAIDPYEPLDGTEPYEG